jgi:hypothetical protein
MKHLQRAQIFKDKLQSHFHNLVILLFQFKYALNPCAKQHNTTHPPTHLHTHTHTHTHTFYLTTSLDSDIFRRYA